MRELDSFFHDIGYRLKIAQDTKKLLDKRLASSFSLFPYLDPKENRLSKIIRDLLDPNGNHGQGDIFLQKFLEVIDKPDLYEIGDQVDIRTEEPTTNIENDKRRIDILIEIKRNNKFHVGVAIENKPWATDQTQQVDDYLDHLSKQYPIYYIIYLTQNGDKPSDQSARKTKTQEKEKLIIMSYKDDITAWLKACYKESQAEYVRQFLLDFSNYCQHNLDYKLMIDDKTEIQTISNYLLETGVTNRIKTAALIANNFKDIEKGIISSFTGKLLDAMKENFEGYTAKKSSKSYPEHGYEITLTKDNWPLFIGINNQNKDPTKSSPLFLIGVLPKPETTFENQKTKINCNKKELIDKIITPKVMEIYGKGEQNAWWFHYSRCEKFECWTQPETLAVLHENPQEAIDYFVEEFRKILAIVKPLIDKHQEILI